MRRGMFVFRLFAVMSCYFSSAPVSHPAAVVTGGCFAAD